MIPPGSTLGLLGGGQLGRMFTARAQAMGYRIWVLDPDPSSPAGRTADRHLQAAYTDLTALDELANGCAVVTTEFENVPAETMVRLAPRIPVWPPPSAVAIAQDRIREKTFLRDQGLPTTHFAAIEHADDIPRAWETVGGPALLKTSRLGYDGKGQATVMSPAETHDAFARFQATCVLERRLELEGELSVVLARSQGGRVVSFPAAENRHVQGILDTTMVPASCDTALRDEAEQIARRVAEALEYVGVLAVELFVANAGRLYVNELAPRPHNSGHYTMDACVTCQFEQQVRAICGLPLGSTALLAPVAMVNLLGDLWDGGEPHWERALQDPAARLHLYGKSLPRPGRKMGHISVLGATASEALERARAARAALTTRR